MIIFGKRVPCILPSVEIGFLHKYSAVIVNGWTLDGAMTEKAKNLDNDEYIFGTPDEREPKLSGIIIEFARDLFDIAESDEEYERGIVFSIAAWNVAILIEQGLGDINHYIDDMLHSFSIKPGSDEEEDFVDLFLLLVDKKRSEYSNVHRYIIDFEIEQTKNNFCLKVLSLPLHEETMKSFFAKTCH